MAGKFDIHPLKLCPKYRCTLDYHVVKMLLANKPDVLPAVHAAKNAKREGHRRQLAGACHTESC